MKDKIIYFVSLILCIALHVFFSSYIFEYAVNFLVYDWLYYPTYLAFILCESLAYSGAVFILYFFFKKEILQTSVLYAIFFVTAQIIYLHLDISFYHTVAHFFLYLFYSIVTLLVFLLVNKIFLKKRILPLNWLTKITLLIFCSTVFLVDSFITGNLKGAKFTSNAWQVALADDSICYRGKYAKHLITILQNNQLNYSKNDIFKMLGDEGLMMNDDDKLSYNLGYCSFADYASINFIFDKNQKLKKIYTQQN